MRLWIPLIGLSTVLLAACSDPGEPAADAAERGSSTTGSPAAEEDAAATPPIPDTEIWLMDLGWARGMPVPGEVENITQRPGYDNQPAFLPDGSALLYSSIRDDGQADIWRYDIAEDTHSRVTHTPEPEYSPTPVDGGFSTVRVEADGSQLLWRYTLDGQPLEVILPDTPTVGYHTWLDEGSLGLFLVGDTMTLHTAELDEAGTRLVAQDIGRALHRVPGTGELSFVDLSAGETGPWVIRAMDPETGDTRTVADTLSGSQDLTWEPGGGVFQGQGHSLYYLPPGATRWREVADLSATLQGEISRLAVSPQRDRLALVTVSEANP